MNSRLAASAFLLALAVLFTFPSGLASSQKIGDRESAQLSATLATRWNLSNVGQIGGLVNNVAINGQYAYLATGPRLVILDISDPMLPVRVGMYDGLQSPREVVVEGTRAYVADFQAGFVIFDVSDPQAPHKLGVYNNGTSATAVAVSGNYAYVTHTSAWVRIIDVCNPANPQFVGSYAPAGFGYAQDVAISGPYM